MSKEKVTIEATYHKPQLLATNNPQGSYAAGCPEKHASGGANCKVCERTA